MQSTRIKSIMHVLLAVLFTLTVVLTGCSSQKATTPAATDDSAAQESSAPAATEAPQLEPVDLTWYLDGTPQADIASVEDEMNKILKVKLNVTLHLKIVDWGAFDQKMQVVNAAGENYDLAFTANWANNYYQNVNKGAFIPLDDLLTQYAPTIMETIPKFGWGAAKVQEKIYAIPNYQAWTITNGVGLQKDLADKYGIKPESLKKLEDLEPFLAQVKQNNPELIPFENNKAGVLGNHLAYFGFDEIAGRNIPGVIQLTDTSLKVFNQFETEEYKSLIKTMRDWYQKGYMRKDAATLADFIPDRKAGKTASLSLSNYSSGTEGGLLASMGKAFYAIPTTPSYLLTSSIISTMTGISKTSKNPERAVMLLDLLFKDKDLYNLMAHGIEGKHYKKLDDVTVEAIKDSGYDPQFDWEIGNQFNGYYRPGILPGTWEATIKMNQTAASSPLLGFSFDPSPVKTEIAQSITVTTQYVALLETGSVDPDKILPEFIDKLKKAGSDKILAEEQKQIDAWKLTQSK